MKVKESGTISPPATQDEKRKYKALYKGLHLVFTNKFEDAETHFSKYAKNVDTLSPSMRAAHLVLKGFVKFFRAISTWGKGAIDKALEVIWEAEALAGTDHADPLAAKLVQAHAFLQGAFLQLLQKRFAKAAWNIRSSWKCFQGAMVDLEEFKGSAEVKLEHTASAKLGVGAFNLILSFLPPFVITVTKVMGFSADRTLGLKLLREAYASNRLMSPIAGQVLLTYLTTISSMLAEQTEALRDEAAKVLEEILTRHPNGVFLLWTKTALLRSCKRHEEAIKIAKVAETVCKETPALALMSVWQAGWCNMLLANWTETNKCFLRILNSDQKATKDGVPAFYCYVAGLAAVNSGEVKKGEELLRRVAKEAKNLDVPHEQYANRKAQIVLRALPKISKKKNKVEKTGSTLCFQCQAYLHLIQLIVEWNFVKYIPEKASKQMKTDMDNWYGKRLELNWGDKEMAWYFLFIAHLTFYSSNDHKTALEHSCKAVAYAKRSKVSNSTLMAQCYFFLSNLYLSQDPPDFERAQKKCTRAREKCAGDLAKRMSFLIHALKSRIAKLRKESKESKNKSETKKEESGGYVSGAVGMVGSAMAWGWGAITGEEEDDSDDAVKDKDLEKMPKNDQ
mmetsp:Transcript_13224/g.19769  ORF Transcript_13224/g.19769 Transcript_13224/m.19769 type:complete len:621 (+) Transcript_13224:160-2022(+)|eukprot:CAMPEP_0167760012 /NCGR_PEP_ID=MMETSP0110_2-20121227/11347_1 /TAXON_ID=629695 /ORGANISM="Gymnochlora sp., Strain CCMP2014" /LENGTH=620 /DNA_ID=CAMNT_0007646471 /DNA_START=80 /DNA_END=1942 /DNA_ORIENTATION=+